jgi:hypothetical protein
MTFFCGNRPIVLKPHFDWVPSDGETVSDPSFLFADILDCPLRDVSGPLNIVREFSALSLEFGPVLSFTDC